MSNVYLIRHGESTANAGQRTANHREIPLTELGREQAETVTNKIIANLPTPTHIVSSPYQRARETAMPLILATGLQLLICDDLREITYLSPSKVNGTNHDERRALRDEFWTRTPNNFDYRDGQDSESLNDFYESAKRALEFLTNLARQTDSGQIFAFSHETKIAAICALANHDQNSQFLCKLARDRKVLPPIRNTEVAQLALRDSGLVVSKTNLFGI